MLIAEELEVDLAQVTLEAAPPDDKLYANPLLGFQVTGGSTSVMAMWEPLRRAGATARVMLIAAAADEWNVDPSSCRAEKGEVIDPPTGQRLKYGALVDAAAKLPVPANVTLKDPKDFTLIGTPAKRIDTPDKVNGKAAVRHRRDRPRHEVRRRGRLPGVGRKARRRRRQQRHGDQGRAPGGAAR